MAYIDIIERWSALSSNQQAGDLKKILQFPFIALSSSEIWIWI